jgi:hypothetical protein
MVSSILKLKIEINSEETFKTRFHILIKQGEGEAWPSVVMPLHTGLLISCCFSTKPPIRENIIKIMHPLNFCMTHTKPQLLTLRNHRVTVSQSQGQQMKKKRVIERPRPGRIRIWKWFPIKNLRPASRIFIEIAKYFYTALNLFWDDPTEILIFYRGACTFPLIFAILTPPPIL